MTGGGLSNPCKLGKMGVKAMMMLMIIMVVVIAAFLLDV